jgi:hypothetical protein
VKRDKQLHASSWDVHKILMCIENPSRIRSSACSVWIVDHYSFRGVCILGSSICRKSDFTDQVVSDIESFPTGHTSSHIFELSLSVLPMSGITMENGLADDRLRPFLLRLILYTPIGILVVWLYHLVKPALVAALSPDYRKFSWVDGKRGVGSFLKSTWDVAFKSEELFAEIHRKVRCPKQLLLGSSGI